MLATAVAGACAPNDRETGDTEALRISRLLASGRYQEAESQARTYVETTRAASGKESGEAANASDLLVEALWRGGKASDPGTRELATATLAIKERLLPPDDPEIARSLNNLGNLLRLAGDARQAEPVFERALALREKKLGADHPDVAQSLTGLAAVRLDLGNREAARSAFERALAIRERSLGAESVEVAQSLNNLAALSRLDGDYALARRRLERAIGIWEKRLGPEHPHVGQALENLAQAIQLSGDAAAAQPFLERALEIKARTLGPDHPAVAQTLDALGSLRWTLGDPASAEPLLVRALAIQEKSSGPDHPSVAAVLSTLGNVRLARGDLPGAMPLLERALRIREARLGPEHPDTADALNNLAIASLRSGDPVTARRMHERALAIRRAALGPEHPAVADSLNNLGNVFLDLGDLATARHFYSQALGLRKRTFGDDHPRVAETMNNLGVLCALEGDLPGARDLLARALAIRRATRGSSHPDLAESLHNLGDVLAELGDFDAAQPLYGEALRIRRVCFGAEHPAVAETLNNEGNLEFRAGNLAASSEKYAAAFAIREKVLGPGHLATSESLNNLASVRLLEGKIDEARNLFERALEIRERSLGPRHPQVALVLDNLAATALRAGRPSEALSFRRRALRIWVDAVGESHVALVDTWEGIADACLAVENWRCAVDAEIRAERLARIHVKLIASRLAERRARRYEDVTRRGLDIALTAIADGRTPDLTGVVLDSVVRSRAMVLDALVESRKAASQIDDPVGDALRRRLVDARSRLSALVFRVPDRLPPARWREIVSKARDEAENAEESLAAWSERTGVGRRPDSVGMKEVASSLPPGAALISYSRFRRARPGESLEAPGSSIDPRFEYVAWVVPGGGGRPFAVALGPAAPIEDEVRAWRLEIAAARGALNVPAGPAEARYCAVGDRLRTAIWDPVARRLGKRRMVLVVPDGSLSFVSFAALPSSNGVYLAETGPAFHYLSTERDAVRRTGRNLAGEGLLVVAQPEFGTPTRAPDRDATLRFAGLPGSLAEASDVIGAWTAAQGSAARGPRILSGIEATESSVKSDAGHYRVVHFATHGFVLRPGSGATSEAASDPTRSGASGVIEDNPLLRAGIALAGANLGASRDRVDASDDGLLTAEEIAALDLGRLDWVVLSACDTGLGVLDAAEGILGLRRAFQLAGAHTIIMSLWPIEDASTRGFMRRLYAHRGRGESTLAATQSATVETLEALRASGRSTHPCFWGAFVACGDWR